MNTTLINNLVKIGKAIPNVKTAMPKSWTFNAQSVVMDMLYALVHQNNDKAVCVVYVDSDDVVTYEPFNDANTIHAVTYKDGHSWSFSYSDNKKTVQFTITDLNTKRPRIERYHQVINA